MLRRRLRRTRSAWSCEPIPDNLFVVFSNYSWAACAKTRVLSPDESHGSVTCDMVKCELRVANVSCELLTFCELRVTSCIYFASYELLVALIMRVASCELNERCELETQKCELETQKCELETQKCELRPKVRVACFLL